MEFHQIAWDEFLIDDCRHLIRLAVREDLGRSFDLTTLALISVDAVAECTVVARQAGVIAGLPAAKLVLDEMGIPATWQPLVADGDAVREGTPAVQLAGPARDLLTAERIVLNFLGRLSGIASLTRRYVDAIAGSRARIYDTRKTTPGWRRLEKYAVRCGGGWNHRTGLFDAVLIKDNHLAQVATNEDPQQVTPGWAVHRARQFLVENSPGAEVPIEVEVDTLEQFDQVLPSGPHIVLLDNMSTDQLREAVRRRDAAQTSVELEASGGISLDSVAAVAQTGVERISVGALTHSAIGLDLGLDWDFGQPRPKQVAR